MPSDALDIDAVVATSGSVEWTGFPEGSTVGHVHLQVGAIPAAEAFYSNVLGFAVTSRYPGGTFYGADGYHHHIATNIWNSRGAGPRSYPSTGLANIEIVASSDFLASASTKSTEAGISTADQPRGLTLSDPWGTEISIVASANNNIQE